jgi:hypothetical protein
MSTPKILRCRDVEKLIVQHRVDKLEREEFIRIHHHLESCEKCMKFYKTLDGMEGEMTNLDQINLIPRPEIRQHLYNRMKLKTSNTITERYKSIKALRRVLIYRIPVYQALVAISLVAVILFSINHLSSSTESLERYTPLDLLGETFLLDSVQTIDNFYFIYKQKIGRSVMEDSILTRHMVTSM